MAMAPPMPRLLTPLSPGGSPRCVQRFLIRGADHLAPTSALPGSCSLARPDSNLCPQQRHLGLGVTDFGGGQNIWEGQATSGQLFSKTPIQLFHRSLSPFAHSLVLLFIECLLCVSPCCRHWGCSMNKTDQPLPSKSRSQ